MKKLSRIMGLLLITGLVGAPGVGCQTSSHALKPEGLAGPKSPPGFDNEKSLIESLPAVEALPQDTLSIFFVDSIQDVANQLGKDQLIGKYRKEYESAVAVVTQMTGHNLLEPENLKAIGIDPGKPAGFAWLKAEGGTVAYVFPLSDSQRFKTFLYQMAPQISGTGGVIEPQVIGNALVYQLKAGLLNEIFHLVVKDDQLILILSDKADLGMQTAKEIASIQKEESLGTNLHFIQGIQNLKYGIHGAGFLNMSAVVETFKQYPKDEEQYEIQDRKRLEESLKEIQALDDKLSRGMKDPKERKQAQNKIQRLRKSIESQKSWLERRSKSFAAGKELNIEWLGGLKGIFLGFTIDGPVIRTKLFASLSANAKFNQLVQEGEGIPLLFRSLNRQPAFAVYGRIRPEIWLEFMEVLFGLNGDSFEEVKKRLMTSTQIDLDKDILPDLSGEMGVAIGFDWESFTQSFESSDKAFKALDVSATVGFADSEKAGKFLKRLIGIPILAPLAGKDSKNECTTLSIPGWKTLYLFIVGNSLLVSSEKAVMERAGKPVEKSDTKLVWQAELKQLFTWEDPAAVWSMDMAMWGYLFWTGTRVRSHATMEPDPEVPFSEESQKKQAEIEQVENEIGEEYTRREMAQLPVLSGLLQRIGTTAFHVRKTKAGFSACGGHFFQDDDIPSFVAHLIMDIKNLQALDSEHDTKINALHKKDRALKNELWELRERDRQKNKAIPPSK